MVGREPRIAERDHRERGVPHRRLARFEPPALLVLDREVVEPAKRALDHGMVERVAERDERDDRPDPRGLDAAPGPVGLLPFDDPPLGGPERASTQRPDGSALVEVERTVEPSEEPVPCIRGRRRGRRADGELVDREGHRGDGSQRAHHGERHDRLPRPAAERVHRERGAGREEDLLGRQGGHRLPGPEPEEREPHAGEHAGRREPAALPDEGRGAPHVLCVRRVAGEPERDVRLDRGRVLGRPAVERRPASVLALARADPARRRLREPGVEEAEVVAEEQILGVDRHVGLELALPPAVGVLHGE